MTSRTNYGWQSLTGHTRKFLSLNFLQVLLRLGLKLRHLTADKDHSIPQVRVANNLKNRISVLVTLGTLTFYSNATAILAVAYDLKENYDGTMKTDKRLGSTIRKTMSAGSLVSDSFRVIDVG